MFFGQLGITFFLSFAFASLKSFKFGQMAAAASTKLLFYALNTYKKIQAHFKSKCKTSKGFEQ